MIPGIITTPEFDSARDRVDRTAEWRQVHQAFIGALGRIGTLVAFTEINDQDADLAPGYFIREEHDFIFPPQPEVALPEAEETVENDHPSYAKTITAAQAIFDPEKASGHLRVIYDDTHEHIHFETVDILEGQSAFPKEISAALHEALTVMQPPYKSVLGRYLLKANYRFPGSEEFVAEVLEQGIEAAQIFARFNVRDRAQHVARSHVIGQIDVIARHLNELISLPERFQIDEAGWKDLLKNEAAARTQ